MQLFDKACVPGYGTKQTPTVSEKHTSLAFCKTARAGAHTETGFEADDGLPEPLKKVAKSGLPLAGGT